MLFRSERDPAAVAEDIREQKLSITRARERYGVVFDASANAVDVVATARERERLRAESTRLVRP